MATPEDFIDYQDPETGLAYEVGYNLYVDPVQVVLEEVRLNGKPVRHLPPGLRGRMKRAALAAYEAESRKQWDALERAYQQRQARTPPVAH